MSVILDTDPGVDDMLTLLLLLASSEIDFKMISLTFGNCSLFSTLKNTLSLMKVVDDENKWRASNGMAPFTTQRPAIYVGSSEALQVDGSNKELPEEIKSLKTEHSIDATDVHGDDGLAGVHSSNPEYDAPDEWFHYFESPKTQANSVEQLPFIPGGTKPSWRAIIDLLKSEPENTVSILAIGPLTNIAKAATYDPVAFSRVKQVVSMGGALSIPGNITPLAEFNVYADPLAAAKVYALTSHDQKVVLPKTEPEIKVPKPLRLVIFPLNITHKHFLYKRDVEAVFKEYQQKFPDSRLFNWVSTWLIASFANYAKLIGKGPDHGVLNLHDPLTAAFVLDYGEWGTQVEDVRVETGGLWSLGATITDDRGRARSENNPHDLQKWLTTGEGNQVVVVKKSPVQETFNKILLHKILNF